MSSPRTVSSLYGSSRPSHGANSGERLQSNSKNPPRGAFSQPHHPFLSTESSRLNPLPGLSSDSSSDMPPRAMNRSIPKSFLNDPAFSSDPRSHPHFVMHDDETMSPTTLFCRVDAENSPNDIFSYNASKFPPLNAYIPHQLAPVAHVYPTLTMSIPSFVSAASSSSSSSTSARSLDNTQLPSNPSNQVNSNSVAIPHISPNSPRINRSPKRKPAPQYDSGPMSHSNSVPTMAGFGSLDHAHDGIRDPLIHARNNSVPEIRPPPQQPLPFPRANTAPLPGPSQANTPNVSSTLAPLGRRRLLSRTHDLDKIDEMDESDPLGMAWHHGGPYEAVGTISRSGVPDHPQLFDSVQTGRQNSVAPVVETKAHIKPPPHSRPIDTVVAPTSLSINLKPGQILSRTAYEPPLYPRSRNNLRGPILSPPPAYSATIDNNPHSRILHEPHVSPNSTENRPPPFPEVQSFSAPDVTSSPSHLQQTSSLVSDTMALPLQRRPREQQHSPQVPTAPAHIRSHPTQTLQANSVTQHKRERQDSASAPPPSPILASPPSSLPSSTPSSIPARSSSTLASSASAPSISTRSSQSSRRAQGPQPHYLPKRLVMPSPLQPLSLQQTPAHPSKQVSFQLPEHSAPRAQEIPIHEGQGRKLVRKRTASSHIVPAPALISGKGHVPSVAPAPSKESFGLGSVFGMKKGGNGVKEGVKDKERETTRKRLSKRSQK